MGGLGTLNLQWASEVRKLCGEGAINPVESDTNSAWLTNSDLYYNTLRIHICCPIFKGLFDQKLTLQTIALRVLSEEFSKWKK